MKSLFKATILLILFSLQACKKQDKAINVAEANFSSKEKELISNYLGGKKEKTGDRGRTGIDSVLYQISWDQYYIAADDFGNKVTVFALKNSLVNNMFLLLFSGKNDGIYSGAQLAVLDKDINVFSKLEVLAKLYTNKEVFFTGSIEYFRITKEFLYKHGYENGIKEYTAIREYKKKSSDIENATEEETCYNVYLITYWSDGSTTYDFLYSYCVAPDCPDLRAGGSVIISTGTIENTTECGGSGSNGGGPGGSTPPSPSCENPPSLTEILNSSSSVSETIYTTVGEPFIRPNIGLWERHITKKWTFHKGNTPLGSFYCTSTERAIQRKATASSDWAYVSISHLIHGITNSIPLIDATITSLTATGSVLSPTRVKMQLFFNIRVEVVCGGINIAPQQKSGLESGIEF